MTSWYVLIVTLLLGSHETIAVIPVKTWVGCNEAMTMQSEIMLLSHDKGEFMLQCRDTGVPLMRPVARPERG